MGMSVSDAKKRLKELSTEHTRLKKLLAESVLENEVTREALEKKWQPPQPDGCWCGPPRRG